MSKKTIIILAWLLSLFLMADITVWWVKDAHKEGLSKIHQASPDRCIQYLKLAECECKGGF